ncbi:unnamed protein product [Spirodela intermedia]|uniref:Uncharacterized protein n=1 Tax=Spirodela intermedia TaxID=51605 RepID=A0A7I8KCF8_SPIIN|nr:unnamed protein product [Spirodela intermedia]
MFWVVTVVFIAVWIVVAFTCGCASSCSVDVGIHGGGGMGNVIIDGGGCGGGSGCEPSFGQQTRGRSAFVPSSI